MNYWPQRSNNLYLEEWLAERLCLVQIHFRTLESRGRSAVAANLLCCFAYYPSAQAHDCWQLFRDQGQVISRLLKPAVGGMEMGSRRVLFEFHVPGPSPLEHWRVHYHDLGWISFHSNPAETRQVWIVLK